VETTPDDFATLDASSFAATAASQLESVSEAARPKSGEEGTNGVSIAVWASFAIFSEATPWTEEYE
jgi:hypothetical protein